MSFCCLSKTTGAHFFQKNCLGGGEGGGGVSKIVLTRQNMSLIYFATIPNFEIFDHDLQLGMKF